MVSISHATPEDAEDILALQKLAYQSEAVLYNDWSIPPLTQTIESLREEFPSLVILKATFGERIVGSVRAKVAGDTCAIGRLIVLPEFQGKGIGSRLLQTIERSCNNVAKFELFTGSKSESNIRLYQRAGYRITKTQVLSPSVSITILEKTANAAL
ncbi:MAG: GNAT family N-acetyltransferase [Thiolinea sp.]